MKDIRRFNMVSILNVHFFYSQTHILNMVSVSVVHLSNERRGFNKGVVSIFLYGKRRSIKFNMVSDFL